MKNRCILIVVGGMCTDALRLCKNPYVKELLGTSAANVNGKSVPCTKAWQAHDALIYSTGAGQKNENGRLFDVLCDAGKKCAAFYSCGEFAKNDNYNEVFCKFLEGADSDKMAAEELILYIKENAPDFTFLYLGKTDEAGHKSGFMGMEYLKAVHSAFEYIKKIREAFPLHKLIITADHGGHGFGFDGSCDSDITIPVILNRVCNFKDKLYTAEIIDIAPTVCKMLGIPVPENWEGGSLI